MLLVEQYFTTTNSANIRRDYSFWPAERVEKLKQLCQDKSLSAKKIAVILGITRNAVVGKCSRMGLELPGHLYGAVRTTPEERKARANFLRRGKRKYVPVGKARWRLAPDYACPDDLPRFDLLDLKSDQCRWPYGEDSNMKFCGTKVVEKRSYCPFHCCIAYRKAGAK